MIPLAVIIIIYAGIPAAGGLGFIAALMLKDSRPKRAKLVIWSAVALLIGGVGLMSFGPMIPMSPTQLETLALGYLGLFSALMIIGSASLLAPPPERKWATAALVVGFALLGLGVFLAVELANTNFGL